MSAASLYESKSPRRLIYRPDSGVDVIDWLKRFTSLPSPRWAEVRVYGTARSLELRSLMSIGTAQRLTGTIDLMDVRGMCGPSGPSLRGQLVLERKQLLSGDILKISGDALVVAIDLLGELEPFSDGVPDAPETPNDETASAEGDATKAAGWGDVLAASIAKNEEDGEDESGQAIVKAGDFIDHPKFGRCRVDRIEGDQRFATVRTHQHRMLRLSLEVLDLKLGGRDGKARIWKVLQQGPKG